MLLIIISSFPLISTLEILQKAIAKAPPSEGSKVLVDDAIQDLKSNNIKKAQVHLSIFNQQLLTFVNSSSIQAVKVLLDDITSALNSDDVNKAVVQLNLIKQQLSNPTD
jgi:hypothetical protein